MKKISRAVIGMTAAAAAFSVICITNPTFAENVPVVGGVFETLGNSLGFYGDFDKYASKLAEDTVETAAAETTDSTADTGETTQDSAYSKTVDGTTITLSEVYCNDEALYLALQIQSEDAFPDTETYAENGKPVICFGNDSKLQSSFSSEEDPSLLNSYLDGQFTDDHTFTGVLRLETSELTADGETQIPDSFTMDLVLKDIVGTLPQDQVTTPEMPEDLQQTYEDAMAENGLSTEEGAYDSFTDEQKDIEHQLFAEMWNAYYERYPEANQVPNSYENWTMDGEWNFSVDVTKNDADTVTKEINLVDKDGCGVISVAKTPFEIELTCNDPESKYVAVMFDADGNFISGRTDGSMYTAAVQDSDVSRISVYVCDYNEYMDELKGYYNSDDYEENAKTKTFQQLLDERAVMKSEVDFS